MNCPGFLSIIDTLNKDSFIKVFFGMKKASRVFLVVHTVGCLLSLFLYAKGSSKLSSTSSSLSANGSTKFSGDFATTPEDAHGAGVAPF